jgi:hypothetical protein
MKSKSRRIRKSMKNKSRKSIKNKSGKTGKSKKNKSRRTRKQLKLSNIKKPIKNNDGTIVSKTDFKYDSTSEEYRKEILFEHFFKYMLNIDEEKDIICVIELFENFYIKKDDELSDLSDLSKLSEFPGLLELSDELFNEELSDIKFIRLLIRLKNKYPDLKLHEGYYNNIKTEMRQILKLLYKNYINKIINKYKKNEIIYEILLILNFSLNESRKTGHNHYLNIKPLKYIDVLKFSDPEKESEITKEYNDLLEKEEVLTGDEILKLNNYDDDFFVTFNLGDFKKFFCILLDIDIDKFDTNKIEDEKYQDILFFMEKIKDFEECPIKNDRNKVEIYLKRCFFYYLHMLSDIKIIYIYKFIINYMKDAFNKDDYPIISVGSGNAMTEHVFLLRYPEKKEKLICVDPDPESYNKGKIYIHPNYDKVDTLIKEKEGIVNNCHLLLMWPTNSDDDGYDIQAINNLNPLSFVIFYSSDKKTSGSDGLINFLEKQKEEEEKRYELISTSKLIHKQVYFEETTRVRPINYVLSYYKRI